MSIKKALASTTAITLWTKIVLVLIGIVATEGRTLLHKLIIDSGGEIKHFGIMSAIVWFTFWVTLIFGTKNRMVWAMGVHYLCFHYFVVIGHSITLGRFAMMIYLMYFMTECWNMFNDRCAKNT